MKLLGFGRPAQRRGGGFPAGDESRHFVEVAGADFALMFSRGVTIGLGCELCLLQFGIGRHSALAVTVCKLEHAVIEGVKSGQGNELKLVAHRAQLALEVYHCAAVKFFLPVE